MLNNLFSVRIVESPHCTITKERVVKRTWRKRLWSWPWKPWQKTKIEYYSEPDPSIYQINGVYVCHPAIATQFENI